MPLRIDVKAGERFFLNNTIMYLTRSAGIIIESKATFLLDRDCIRKEDANTAAQHVHYFCQQIYLHEDRLEEYRPLLKEACAKAVRNAPDCHLQILQIDRFITQSEFFRALKLARLLSEREKCGPAEQMAWAADATESLCGSATGDGGRI